MKTYQQKNILLWNPIWLTQQYHDHKRAITDIAKEIGCHFGTVKNALIKLGIERRPYTFSDKAKQARIKGSQSRKHKEEGESSEEKINP